MSKSSTEWLGTDELLETETEVAESDTVEELAKRIADSIFEDYGVLSINDCYFSNGGYILNVEVTNDYPYRVNGILKVHFNKDGKQVHTLPIVLPSGGIAAGKTMTIQGLNSYHEDFDSYSFDTSSIREM